METELIRALPHWFRDIRDFEVLMESESGELAALALAMEAVGKNLRLALADTATVTRWENFLHIVPRPEVESLDFRRARLQNRLSAAPPFTLRFLYERLDLLIGAGKWAVTVDYPGSTLYVEAAAGDQMWAGEVAATIDAAKPCHIVYLSRPLVPARLDLSGTVNLLERVFCYRLGYWGLGSQPFVRPEDRGVIVTQEQHSLQEQLCKAVAAFTADEVAAVRINGALVLTEFDIKAAAGNTATIAYTVAPAQVGTVTQLELLDAGGQVLQRAPVYVPVVNPVQLTHRIPVKEGI